MKKIYMLFMSLLLLLSCTRDDVSKSSEWPEWSTPSKPKIENAVLRGVNGETVVTAGDKVKFATQVSDECSDLASFRLLVTMDETEILNLSKGLSGRSAVIEEEATLPFVAGFQNGRPVMTIKAVNNLGSNKSTLTLDKAASAAVTRPETPSQLYLVGDLGNIYEIDEESQNEANYSFRASTADLAGIGDHFKVTEKMVNNKPDYSGLIWRYSDDKITIVTGNVATSIPTPKAESYALESVTFGMLSFLADRTLIYSIDIDESRFSDMGRGYVQLGVQLVESAKINFIGFGNGVTNMLRPEFFKDVSGSKAKFDGPSVLYNSKYNASNGFIYTERSWDVFYSEVMYIVGTGARFPHEPYVATLAWDFVYPHRWFFLKKVGASASEAVVYINQTIGLKFYRGYGWAQEEDTENLYTVEPANLVARSALGDLIPGPDFKAGLYTIHIDRASEIVRLTPYN